MRHHRLRAVLSDHAMLVGIAAAYLVAVGVILPSIDPFPSNDDWDYAATAQELAHTGRLRLSPWPAMTLVTHAVWGAGFLRVFGDSWWALRVSTMVMAWIGGLSIYAIALRFGRPRGEAALLCGSYVGAPLVLALSYTFMTDVAGASLMLLTLAASDRALRRDAERGFMWVGLAAGLALMARQTAIIPAAAFVLVLLGRRRIRSVGAFSFAALAVPAAGYLWMSLSDGLPSGLGRNTYDFALLLDLKGVAAKGLVLLLEAALMLSPLAVLFAGHAWTTARRIGLSRCVIAGLLWIAFLAVFADELRPYRGYSLFDCGLGYGPRLRAHDVLKSGHLLGAMTTFHVATLAVAGVCMPILLIACLPTASAERETGFNEARCDLDSRITVGISIGVYMLLLIILRWNVDRYVIPLVGLCVALLAADRQRPSARFSIAAALVWLGSFGVSLVGLQDATIMKTAYWEPIVDLQRSGVSLKRIDIMWCEPDRLLQTPTGDMFRRSSTSAAIAAESPLPSSLEPDSKDCQIAYAPQEGWRVVRSVPYQSWVRSGSLFVLRREALAPGEHAASAE